MQCELGIEVVLGALVEARGADGWT